MAESNRDPRAKQGLAGAAGWFSLVSLQCIRRGVFHSVRHLVSDIKSYTEKYNKSAKPFTWTATDPGGRIAEPISGGAR